MPPRRSSLLGLNWVILGCSGPAEIPDTPNLEELQSRYDRPTAVLDPVDVANAVREVPSLADLAAGFHAADYVVVGVDESDELAEQSWANGLRIQGTIQVALRCPGSPGARDGGSGGTLSLTVGVAESLVRRGVRGVASQCVLRGDRLGVPVPVVVDGPVEFDLGRDLRLGERWTGRLLMVVRGTMTVEGVTFRNVSARWTSALLEHLVELDDGTTVVLEVSGQGVAVRGRDAIWICSVGEACRPG